MVAGSLRRLILALTAVAVGGCASFEPLGGDPADDARTVTVVEAASRDNAGVDAGDGPQAALPQGAAAFLVEEARALAQAGDYERAAAQIERALRIEPANPWLYLELAQVRLQSGDASQGARLLERARSLAGGDARIAQRASELAERFGAERATP